MNKFKPSHRMLISMLFLLFALAFVPALHADNVGLGVSIKSSQTTVYLPIKIREFYRIEPFINYYKNSKESKLRQASGSRNNDNSSYEAGIGLFKSNKLRQNTNLYYGLRASYTKYSYEEDSTFSSSGRSTYSYSSERLILSPTVGVEHSFTQQFVLAFEAEVYFGKLKGKNRSNLQYYFNDSDDEQELSGSNTRVILRYFF